MGNQIQKEFQQKTEPVRLNKYLSEAGVCSRREADRLIASGRVTVDGRPGETGMKVCPGQKVCIGKKVVSRQEEMVLLAVNKPVGIVCTEERRERNSIIRYLDYPVRITYIGRLDKDSRGLLLMTNNGDIINKIMRAVNRHEKEYKVTVDRQDDMLAGIMEYEQIRESRPPGDKPPMISDMPWADGPEADFTTRFFIVHCNGEGQLMDIFH